MECLDQPDFIGRLAVLLVGQLERYRGDGVGLAEHQGLENGWRNEGRIDREKEESVIGKEG